MLDGHAGSAVKVLVAIQYSVAAAATLLCSLSSMACFAEISVSQGSVATYARCSGIFNIYLTSNLLRNLPVKFF